MEYEYRNLMEQIRPSAELNARVLTAVGEVNLAAESMTAKRRPVWRAAVCAVLALVLVAGGVSRRNQPPPEQVEFAEDLDVMGVACDLGMTSYAADVLPAANGNLVLGGGDGVQIQTTDLQPERAQYTQYRFRICGENIETLTLSMDRCGLYRARTGQSLISILENPAEEEYDPEAVYGLWIPPQVWVQGQGTSILDGAKLTVVAHFADGTDQTNVYRLSFQQLLVSENEDGTELLIPALEGSEPEGFSGLYLESLNSVWLHWPVEGSNTVSLSNRYGYRWNPGGETKIFHSGIDIPAPQGSPVLAAADGRVTETGFDPERGNYLVLDHGDGLTTLYAQCRSVEVEEGDNVVAGGTIAVVGSTGMATGPHLHFEVRQNGEAQNPVAYFDREVRETLRMR